eukprot:7367059-Karenia_brevis.AAC.1
MPLDVDANVALPAPTQLCSEVSADAVASAADAGDVVDELLPTLYAEHGATAAAMSMLAIARRASQHRSEEA